MGRRSRRKVTLTPFLARHGATVAPPAPQSGSNTTHAAGEPMLRGMVVPVPASQV
jgi:hypothetical protein